MKELSLFSRYRLWLSGWKMNRKYDISKYLEVLEMKGLRAIEPATEFFKKFGGIEIKKMNFIWSFQEEDIWEYIEKVELECYNEHLKIKLNPVGYWKYRSAHPVYSRGGVYVSSDKQMYFGFDGFLHHIGTIHTEAINRICSFIPELSFKQVIPRYLMLAKKARYVQLYYPYWYEEWLTEEVVHKGKTLSEYKKEYHTEKKRIPLVINYNRLIDNIKKQQTQNDENSWEIAVFEADGNCKNWHLKENFFVFLDEKQNAERFTCEIERYLRRAIFEAEFRIETNEDLLFACSDRTADDIQMELITGTGVDLEVKRGSGRTPLICASTINGGNIEVVKGLLKAGANVNAVCDDGKTALIYATGNACPDIVELLVEAGADVTIKDTQGKTALDYAEELPESSRKNKVLELLRGNLDPSP